MANQNPQPEIYSVVATFPQNSAQGATVQNTITTSQANNEEVRVYSIQVDMQAEDNDALDPTTATNCDFSLTIGVGPNNVPSQTIRLRPIWSSEDKMLYFTTPILVLYQQPFTATVTCNQALPNVAGEGRTITINFNSDLSIQEVACAPGDPRSQLAS